MSDTPTFGPPHSEEYLKMVSQFPPAEELVAECIPPEWDGGAALARGETVMGAVRCDHMGLMGPPGRVHGGLHVLVRIFSILDRIPTHEEETAFPCAFNMELLKALPMGGPHAFSARYRRDADGQWMFASRFLETPRLDALAWSLPDAPIISDERLAWWKERYDAACASGKVREENSAFSQYRGTPQLAWARIHPDDAGDQAQWVRRYQLADGVYSLAFMCVQTDNAGGISRAFGAGVPTFTTRLALKIAARRIPTDEPLLVFADREHRYPTPFVPTRPVQIGGKERVTETGEVLLVKDDFSRVYAHGWIDTHPIDLSKFKMLAENPFAE